MNLKVLMNILPGKIKEVMFFLLKCRMFCCIIKWEMICMKKIIAALCAAVFLISSVASAEGIYSYATETKMPGGAKLRNIRRFYGDYALNINCVEADLKNEGLSLSLLKNPSGCDKVDLMDNLAKTVPGVVAATNADFFSYYSGSQNFSLGIEVKDGKLLQSHIDTSTMAAGILSGNSLSLSYISFSAYLSAANGAVMAVTHINKPTKYYGALLMYTADYNGGTSPYLPQGITVVTVADGTVSAKGTSMGGTVPIPENGYILAIDDSMTPFLNENMNVGDKVKLDVSAAPSIENAKTAFGGGTMLLSGGKKTKITHSVNGINPRTAVGTNADGTVVYLITVDGRQRVSRGVTLDALADICLELGCVNAMNLDGGGSTRMVGKTIDNSELHTVNYPSENRKVINAVAVTSSAEPGKAAGFEVKPEANNVLAGDSVKINVIPYDANYNTPSDNSYELKWVISKGSGRIENNVFYAGSGGETVADLYCNDVWQTSCVFNVINDVYGILTNKSITLKKGEGISQSIASVYDKDGNTAQVRDISLLKPSCDLTLLSFDNGKITALREGFGELALSYGDVRRSISVSCGSAGSAAVTEAVTRDELKSSDGGGYRFTVFAGAPVNTLFGRINYAAAAKTLGSASASAILGGAVLSDITPNGVSPLTADGYSESRFPGALAVSLVMSGGSLKDRQWNKLTAAVSSASEKNIFVLLKDAPIFSDTLESDVFRDYLSDIAKNKNVFVVYNGNENLSFIKNGVRYIALADESDFSSLSEKVEKMKYVTFNITQEGATYSLNKLYASSGGATGAYSVY